VRPSHGPNHADVFVSIHLNGFHDPGVDGTEVWIARAASQASADLAREVLDRLVAVTGVADRGVRRADLGVLVPARHGPSHRGLPRRDRLPHQPRPERPAVHGAYRQQIAQALTAAVLDRIRVPAAVGAPGGGRAGVQSLGIATFLAERLGQYLRNEGGPGDPARTQGPEVSP